MSCELAYDRRYVLSISGLFKVACFLFALVGVICVLVSSAPLHNLRGAVYIAIACLGMLCTAVVFLAHLYQLRPVELCCVKTIKCETYLHGILGMAFFVASVSALTLDLLLYSVAAFFGFLTACIYGFDFYFGFQALRRCDASTQTV